MNYFKNTNNEIFAFDNEQVAQGYGSDLTSLPSGEFTDGTNIYPYNDGYTLIERDVAGNVIAPQTLVNSLSAEADKALQDKYTKAMENLMDTQAQTKGYDTRYTASARAGVTGSPFQVEGQAFAVWMDSCYAMGYKILADVKAGTRTLPTVNAFLAELPVLVW